MSIFDAISAQFQELGFTVVRPPDQLIAYRDGNTKRALVQLKNHSPFNMLDLIALVLPKTEDFDPLVVFATNVSRARYVTENGGFIPNDCGSKMIHGKAMLERDIDGLPQRVLKLLEERDLAANS